MSYKAPPELAAKHPIPQVIPLIEANVRRFETELRAGYDKMQKKAQVSGTSVPAFNAWAFTLLDQVFHDMLEAEADHTSAQAYTEEVGRRLGMKIQHAVKSVGQSH